MDGDQILKSYCLKVALPIVFLTLLCENMFTQGTYLHSKLSKIVQSGTASRFLHERGGLREDQFRGRTFYESINFNIYEGEAAKNIPLKEFMVNHITSYEPAILLSLVDDWPAITDWSLENDSSGSEALK